MDWFGIGSVVKAFLEQGGILAGFGVLAIGVMVWFLQRKLQIVADNSKLEIEAKERERQTLIAEVSESRRVLYNHLEHLTQEMKEDRAAFVKGMEGVAASMKSGFEGVSGEHQAMGGQLSNIQGYIQGQSK